MYICIINSGEKNHYEYSLIPQVFEVIYFRIFVGSIDDFGKRHENVYFRQWPKLHINLVFNAQPKVKT